MLRGVTDEIADDAASSRAEFDAYISRFVKAMNYGQDAETLDWTDDQFDELQAYIDSDEAAELRREGLVLMGEIIQVASSCDALVGSFLAHLISNGEPARAVPAVKAVPATPRLNMLGQVLGKEWPDGTLLVRHLRKLYELRNRFAHGQLASWRIGDDGKLERGLFISGRNGRDETYESKQEPFPLAELKTALLKGRVLYEALQSLIRLASVEEKPSIASHIRLATLMLFDATHLGTPSSSSVNRDPAFLETVLDMFPDEELSRMRIEHEESLCQGLVEAAVTAAKEYVAEKGTDNLSEGLVQPMVDAIVDYMKNNNRTVRTQTERAD